MIAEQGVLSCVKCLGVNRLAGWYLHRRLTNKQNKHSGKSLVSFSYAGSWFTAPGLKNPGLIILTLYYNAHLEEFFSTPNLIFCVI